MNESNPQFTGETRLAGLVRTGAATPRFLQGVFPFAGRGMFEPSPIDDALAFTVPADRTVEVLYFRAGNQSDDLLYFSLTANGAPIRYFPVGPKSDVHVALAIVESHPDGTRLEVCLAAPRGLVGTVVLDVGLVEIEAGK